MKRILALFLAFSMILPVCALQPTADPDTGVVLTEAAQPMGSELAPTAQFTLSPQNAPDLGTGELLLVNGSHHLSTDWLPGDLVSISGARVLKPSIELLPQTKAAWDSLRKAMDKAGLKVYICSGFRTYDYQVNLFNKRMKARMNAGMSYRAAFDSANLYTAYPGTSEHESGLAIDLARDIYATLNDGFADTAVGKWLLENCQDYGFIPRYGKDQQEITGIAYEPWHYRYVGQPHSKIIMDKGWTLEEYLTRLQQGELLTWQEGDDLWTVSYTRDYDSIARTRGLESYSYDNCGGWVLTTRREDPGYYVSGHWSQPYFDRLLGGKPYEGDFAVIPDKPIPVAGFQYLLDLIPGLRDPMWGDLEYISRQSAAVALDGILGTVWGDSPLYLDDGAIAPWARTAVYSVTDRGLMVGTTDGRFNPEATLTWAEAATLLARLRDHLGK